MALDRGIEVEFAKLAALVFDFGQREDFDTLQQRFRFLAPVGLDDSDHHVLAFVAERSRRRQHRVGLANPCRRAEVDPQASATRGLLLRLDFREELVGIGTLVLHAWPSGDRRRV